MRACPFGDSLMGGTGHTASGARAPYVDRARAPGAMSGTYDVVLLERRHAAPATVAEDEGLPS